MPEQFVRAVDEEDFQGGYIYYTARLRAKTDYRET